MSAGSAGSRGLRSRATRRRRCQMSAPNSNRNAMLQWVIVLSVGVLVVVLILALDLIPRLDAGQKVLNGARPAFSSQSLATDVAGIDLISKDVNMADPIVTRQGGAAAEIPAVVAFVAKREHVSQAQ